MFQEVLYSLFNYNLALGIATISIIVTIITTIITKYATDQKSIRKIKKDIKNLNKELRDSSEDQEKAQTIQQQLWPKQMELLKQSFTPMLYYGIPLFLVFGWLGATLGQAPINPGDEFEITAQHEEGLELELQSRYIQAQKDDLYSSDQPETQWKATSNTIGTHMFNITLPNSSSTIQHQVKITDGYGYTTPTKTFDESKVKRVTVQYDKITPFGDFNIFGWRPGWLATYILFGLLSNLAFRKMLNLA